VGEHITRFWNSLKVIYLRIIMRYIIILLFLGLWACEQPAPTAKPVIPVEPKATNLTDQANLVLKALTASDFTALEQYIEPGGQVTFSPYSYIDTTKTLRFSNKMLSEAATGKKMLKWGEYDATGEAIQLTVADYFAQFIQHKPFATADSILVNRSMAAGNMINNISQVFTGTEFVEYYCKGSDEYAGMDWGALRLIFRKKGDKFYLVGVVSDRWTS
jgi:hypothetical protein